MTVEQIQILVDDLANRLGRAVVVDDQDLRLVAVSEDFGDADPARIWSLLHRRTRPEDVNYDTIKRADRPGLVPENPALHLWQRLFVPIRRRGVLLGFIWITDRYATLRDGQIADAVRTAEELGALLERRWLAARTNADERRVLVEQLLSTDPAVRDRAAREVGARGLLCGDGGAAVLLAEVPHSHGAVAEDALRHFCRSAAGAGSLVTAGPGRATVILRVHAGDELAQVRRAASALGTSLAKSLAKSLATVPEPAAGPTPGTAPWRLGGSAPVPGLGDLPIAARQADLALSLAPAGGACLWPDLGPDALIAQLAPTSWDDVLLPPGVSALLADTSCGMLMTTLETYLGCAGDVQRTARQLQVHRTTLYYRLGRIEQISGLNLRDGQDRLLLHLVVTLRRLSGTRSAAPGRSTVPPAGEPAQARRELPANVGTGHGNLRRRAG